MRKAIAALLSASLMISGISAAASTDANVDAPFLQYETYLDFNRSYHRGMRFVEGDVVEGFTCFKNHNNSGAYGYTGDAWRMFSTMEEREKQYQWKYQVDLTQDHIIEYPVTTTHQVYYAPCYFDASGTEYYYIDKVGQMVDSTLCTVNATTRYTLVVDSSAKSIDWYMNGVHAYTKDFAAELGEDAESVTLTHRIYNVQAGLEDNTTDRPLNKAGTELRYFEMDYFTDYIPGDAALQVIDEPTPTQTVVQFNTAINPDTAAMLTVGGNSVAAEDVSADYDLPNVYRLTHEALPAGTYTIQDGGVRGLSPDGTAAGELLGVKATTFTLKEKHGIEAGESYIEKDTDGITATVPITNYDENPAGFTMLLCEYQGIGEKEGKLIRVEMTTHTAGASVKEEPFTVTMTLPAKESGAYTYEAFVWDGVITMNPLTAKSDATIDSPEDYPGQEYTFDGYTWYKATPKYTVDAAVLEALEGQHPRLYITEDFVTDLKADIAEGGSLNGKWTQFITYVDSAVAEGPPLDFDQAAEDYGNKVEQNWIRDVADDLASIAFAYVMTEDAKYLESAKLFVTALCTNYPQWGTPNTGYCNNGLAAAHASRALALTYDWLFEDIGQEYLSLILTTAIERTTALHNGGWWSKSYLQNHLWNDRLGTALMGLAIMDEYPDATAWIEKSVSDYNQVYRHLGLDGGSHEGMLYWDYGMESYLLFVTLARDTLKIDYTIDPFAENTWLAPLYGYFNPEDWQKNDLCLNYADAPIYGGRRLGPSISLDALAKTYNNGQAKWLANRMYESGVAAKESYADWYAFLYQSDVQEVPVDTLPTAHLFEDLGIVQSRSSWDKGASYFHVRCGINQGSEVAVVPSGYNPGTGHVHVDINAPIVYAYGDYILQDDGYTSGVSGKNHSVLYINGSGQPRITEGSYLNRARCAVLKYKDAKAYTYAACDGTDAYGITADNIAAFGLENWVRHFVYLKQLDCLLVIDEVSCSKEQDLQLQWITGTTALTQVDSNTVLGTGDTSMVRIENFDISSGTTVLPQDVAYNSSTRYVTTVNRTAKDWTTATAITWSDLDATPTNVELTQKGDLWCFSVNGAEVTVNIATREVSVVQ